jgi:hypothetical protein
MKGVCTNIVGLGASHRATCRDVRARIVNVFPCMSASGASISGLQLVAPSCCDDDSDAR